MGKLVHKWKGITYLKPGEPEWSDEKFAEWKKNECSKGNHLWDEVWSTDRHYLFCDACEISQTIEPEEE